uniref:Uncharacterized protein n=1 Tax=Spongospora subterranea TaxID=70186 RepID=A0A0H5RMU3_9EUKA|eukprot:CRZ10049.1 hypothetical protein [Spongospora subterranea]
MSSRSVWSRVGDLVSGVALGVTARLGATILSRSIRQMRPGLTDAHQALMRDHFETAFTAFFAGRLNISRQLRGLLAIICDGMAESEIEEIWQQVVHILTAFDASGVIEDEPDAVIYDDHAEAYGVNDTEDPNAAILMHDIQVDPELLKPIPGCIKSALVAELTRTPLPSCSITLDNIVDERGHICPGVVALVQKLRIDPSDPSAQAKFHVFLYKKDALEQWFEVGGNVNPLTRERVHRSSQLFLLS